jgi:hypothetical protein
MSSPCSAPTCVSWILLIRSLAQLHAADMETVTPHAKLQLFNGTNLAGFYTWLVDTRRADPRHVFSAIDGMIRISGDGLGYLSTKQEYQDYHLIAEFKWGRTNWAWGDRIHAARDSGIFLHSSGPDGNSHDGNGAFKAALECQIFQGATGDLLLIRGTNFDGSLIAPRVTAEVATQRDRDGWPFWQRAGKPEKIARWGRLNWFAKDPSWKDELDFRGPRDVEKPYGQWNRIECICDHDRIRVILNDTVVNEAFEVSPRSGKILLQCEGSEIFFRRFELHPLKKSITP